MERSGCTRLIVDIFAETWNIKTAKNGCFCGELSIENNFDAVLANFCCYDYGANASQAVQKINADQKDYHKCPSCVKVCWIAKIY